MSAPRNAVQTNRGRFYKLGDETFVSVTNVIGKAVAKQALPPWAARTAAEFVVENLDMVSALAHDDRAAAIDLIKGSPWRKRDKAALTGTLLHEAAERHVLGQEVAVDDTTRPFFESFCRWVDDYRPTFEAAEYSVFSRTHGYAGTADLVAVIDGERWLIDHKTAEKGPWPEAALQLAALRYADFIGMPNGTEAPVPVVDRCGVLKVRPEGCLLYPVRADEAIHRHFLYCLQTAVFVDEVARDVIGAPLPAPEREEVSS